ncbi:hypothetical protein QRT03_30535 [Actinomycetospora sp. Odt1-22]|uniref:Uncharacterized protein n=1 Tax=Actinomycetospora termitidis TaxID=3053470 RepID=A0ABT7MI29_9PSEU|nr:hypothetical protein [Actinomycetospora sp. Odt1-22]
MAPQLERHVVERGEAGTGRVVVEHVDAAEALGALVDPAGRCLRVGEIDGGAGDVQPLVGERAGCAFRGAVLYVAPDDPRALAREQRLGGLALTAGRAGEEHPLAREAPAGRRGRSGHGCGGGARRRHE